MADRFAELLAIGGIARRLVEDAPRLADGDAGDIDPAAIKRFHSGREAAAFDAADDRSRGDADILEDPVTDPRARLAHLLLDLSDLNALGIGGHEEGADMAVLGEAFPPRSRHPQNQDRKSVLEG